MLEGKLNLNRLLATVEVTIGIEQKLDLTDGAQEEIVSVSEVESLVTFENAWVLASEVSHRGLEETENSLLERSGIVL